MTKILLTFALIPFGIVMYIASQYLYYDSQDANDYIEYTELTFLQVTNNTPKFRSGTIVHKEIPAIRWLDILRCDINGDENYIQFSQYVSARKLIKPHKGETSDWTYNAHTPIKIENATCYLDSTHCIQLPFGIEKCEQVYSNMFKI